MPASSTQSSKSKLGRLTVVADVSNIYKLSFKWPSGCTWGLRIWQSFAQMLQSVSQKTLTKWENVGNTFFLHLVKTRYWLCSRWRPDTSIKESIKQRRLNLCLQQVFFARQTFWLRQRRHKVSNWHLLSAASSLLLSGDHERLAAYRPPPGR